MNDKRIQLISGLMTLFVLFGSLYYQYIEKMIPCPLCLMQRFCVFLLLVLILLSLRLPKRMHVISFFQILFSLGGLYFSLRHLWLMSLPTDEAPACMPGLDTLIHYFPWTTVAHALFWGAGDCAEESARILGLAMPGWALLYFATMFFLGLFLFFKTKGNHQSALS